MIRLLLLCTLTFLLMQGYAQKYDRNWVFGRNAGINFNNLDSVHAFYTSADNFEMTACISDSAGSLLFYLSNIRLDQYLMNLLDKEGNLIRGGDSIRAYQSSASGYIIPSYGGTKFMLFHLGKDGNFDTCGYAGCPRLFMTVVKREGDSLVVEDKNKLLTSNYLFEKLAVVKHANGKDWWVIAHTEYDSMGVLLNRFYRFLICDTLVKGPFIQTVGNPTGDILDYFGQMKISHSGNLLGLLRGKSKIYEVYQMNRCTGLLSFLSNNAINTQYPLYSLEFSLNEWLLYITAGVGEITSELFQVNLTEDTPSVHLIVPNYDVFTQLQFAPDGKIYIGNMCSHVIDPSCDSYLSTISYPDSTFPACGFQLYSFHLGDSSEAMAGLPNMPDYNLGPISIYQADAGSDAVICTEDTTVKGVLLGAPGVPGVIYSWFPAESLNSTDIARPFAFPDFSTWFYVTLIDTSIKNSCQSRLDSVFVEVKDCRVGIAANPKRLAMSIHPNPATSTLHITLPTAHPAIHQITLTDLSGKEALRTTQATIPVSSLPAGLYFVRIELQSGENAVRKVVVE